MSEYFSRSFLRYTRYQVSPPWGGIPSIPIPTIPAAIPFCRSQSHEALPVRVLLPQAGRRRRFLLQVAVAASSSLGPASAAASSSRPPPPPVLIHDGKPVCESLVIVEYVDEVWSAAGLAILPADPYDRAVARFWAAYVDDKLLPAWFGILAAATEEERAEKIEETLAVIGKLEEAFAQCSNGKAFFSGDSVGYLDLALGSHVLWLEALPEIFGVAPLIDASKTPLLAAWAKRFGETEEAKMAAPGLDKAVEYVMRLRASRAAAEAERVAEQL